MDVGVAHEVDNEGGAEVGNTNVTCELLGMALLHRSPGKVDRGALSLALAAVCAVESPSGVLANRRVD